MLDDCVGKGLEAPGHGCAVCTGGIGGAGSTTPDSRSLSAKPFKAS